MVPAASDRGGASGGQISGVWAGIVSRRTNQLFTSWLSSPPIGETGSGACPEIAVRKPAAQPRAPKPLEARQAARDT